MRTFGIKIWLTLTLIFYFLEGLNMFDKELTFGFYIYMFRE